MVSTHLTLMLLYYGQYSTFANERGSFTTFSNIKLVPLFNRIKHMVGYKRCCEFVPIGKHSVRVFAILGDSALSGIEL